MLYIDGKEFTTYFKGKKSVENYHYATTLLFGAFLDTFEIEASPKNYLHFLEALSLYFMVNESSDLVGSVDAGVLFERASHYKKGNNQYSVTSENEEVTCYQLSDDFEKRLRHYYDIAILNGYNLINKYLTEISYYDELTLQILTSIYSFEKYGFQDEVPFTMFFFYKIFMFCTKNSPFNQFSAEKQEKEYLNMPHTKLIGNQI